jgi:Dolichyl-phosphate-mannose-protein mannosyltransferase
VDAALAIATWVVVAVGVALRMRQWLAARPLWLDELLLLRSTRDQTFGSLLDPLPGSQSAPVGWLWAQHVVMRVLGDGEQALRLLPLAFGCASLIVVALLARRVLGPAAALAATCLTACSPLLVYYSNEFKQYSSDVFWTQLVLLVAAGVAARPELRLRQAAVLGGVAAIAVWFSDPALLTGAGVFGALGLVALARRQWRRLVVLVGCAVPFATSAAIEYVLVLSKRLSDPALLAYWQRTFPPRPLAVDSYTPWLRFTVSRLLYRPLVLHPGWLVVALLVAGTLALGVRNRPVLLALLLPAGATLAVATAGVYPPSGRLVLFLVPTVFVVLAASLDLAGLVARRGGLLLRGRLLLRAGLAAAALAGLAALAAPNIGQAAKYTARPGVREDARTVMSYVAAHRGPRDLVLVDRRAGIYAAAHYGPRLGMGSFGTIDVAPQSAACVPSMTRRLLVSRRAYDRVWLVYVHVRRPSLRQYRAELATVGHLATSVRAPGGGVDLYDLAAGPDDPGRGSPMLRARGHHCVRIAENPTGD